MGSLGLPVIARIARDFLVISGASCSDRFVVNYFLLIFTYFLFHTSLLVARYFKFHLYKDYYYDIQLDTYTTLLNYST